MKIPLFLSLLVLLGVVHAHPPTTFTMLLANENNPNTTINKPYNLTFYVYDLLNDMAIVNYSQLVPLHDRYMHVMLACGNMKEVFHLHIDDFSTPEEMLQKNTFFVTVAFPTKGQWFIATSFMTNISGILREGSSQYEFYVEDTEIIFHPTYNYYTTNKFKTYPLADNEMFLQMVNTDSNIQQVDGYTVEVTFTPNTTHIQPYTCQVFYVTVKDPQGQPVTNFIPYLDAPMHIIFVAEADTVYHGHGMDLPSIAPTLNDVKPYAAMAGMHGMEGMTVVEDALMMNSIMMGMTKSGELNCTQDLGAVMQKYKMDPYMDMLPSNYTFGPNFVSIFDFPNFGAWEMFIYFRIKDGNSSKLLIPHFSLNSNNQTAPPTTTPIPVATTTTGSNIGGAASLAMTWSCVLLVAICSLVFL